MEIIIFYNDELLDKANSIVNLLVTHETNDVVNYLKTNFDYFKTEVATIYVTHKGHDMSFYLSFMGNGTEVREKVIPALFHNGFAKFVPNFEES